jgi:hypothetical protein
MLNNHCHLVTTQFPLINIIIVIIINIIIRWGGCSMPQPGHLTPGKTRYPLYRILDGPQGRSGKSCPHWNSIPGQASIFCSFFSTALSLVWYWAMIGGLMVNWLFWWLPTVWCINISLCGAMAVSYMMEIIVIIQQLLMENVII